MKISYTTYPLTPARFLKPGRRKWCKKAPKLHLPGFENLAGVIGLLLALGLPALLPAQSVRILSLQIKQPPFPSPYLSDWEFDRQLLTVTVHSERDLQGRLLASISGLDNHVEISSGRDIVLFAGETRVFATPDLLNWGELSYSGGARKIWESGRIPEGQYELCVHIAYEENGVLLETEKECVFFWIMQPQWPVLLTPVEGDSVPAAGAAFVWMPVQWRNASAASTVNYQYRVKIVELLPGQGAEQALTSNYPFFLSSPLSQTSFFLDSPLLESAKTYLWQVQALDLHGIPLGENGGWSEISRFHTYPAGGAAAAASAPLAVKILYPREGQRVSEPFPVFTWEMEGVEDISGLVFQVTFRALKERQAVSEALAKLPLWQKSVSATLQLEYPGDAPEAEDRAQYLLQVAAFNRTGELLGQSPPLRFSIWRNPRIDWLLFQEWERKRRQKSEGEEITLLAETTGSAFGEAERRRIEELGIVIEIIDLPFLQLRGPLTRLNQLADLEFIRMVSLPPPPRLEGRPLDGWDNTSRPLRQATISSGRLAISDMPDCTLLTADRPLPAALCQLPTAPSPLPPANCRLSSAPGQSPAAKIRAAIFDFGFDPVGLRERIPEGRLKYYSFRQDQRIEGPGKREQNHGNACALEFLESFPDAELFLVNFYTPQEFLRALQFAVDSLGVRIISCSISWKDVQDNYDGTSAFSAKIDQILSRKDGFPGERTILVAAAGNFARSHWEGKLIKADGAAALREGRLPIPLKLRHGVRYDFILSWDDWDGHRFDLDLRLLDANQNKIKNSFGQEYKSANRQGANGSAYPRPLERIIGFEPPWPGSNWYYLEILLHAAAGENLSPPHLELYMEPAAEEWKYAPQASSSLAWGLATTAAVITAGAVDYIDSSQGPANIVPPTIRPDFAASGITAHNPASPRGTSYAAPRVAAAFAWIFSVYPDWSKARAVEFLKNRGIKKPLPQPDYPSSRGEIDLEKLKQALGR